MSREDSGSSETAFCQEMTLWENKEIISFQNSLAQTLNLETPGMKEDVNIESRFSGKKHSVILQCSSFLYSSGLTQMFLSSFNIAPK